MSSLDPDTYGAEKHDQYHKIQSLGEGRYAQVFKYVRPCGVRTRREETT